MATWAEFEAAEPELARRVRERFDIRRHKTLATLRRDGSPRISGIEAKFEAGHVFLGLMPGSVKSRDLERDPRLALHGPTVDPPPGDDRAWPGEAKLAGRAVPAGENRVSLDIDEVVLTQLGATGDRLVVESWRPGSGYRRQERG